MQHWENILRVTFDFFILQLFDKAMIVQLQYMTCDF